MEITASASLSLLAPTTRRKSINSGPAWLVAGLIATNVVTLADNTRGLVLDPLSFEQRELVPLFEVSSGYHLSVYQGSIGGPLYTITQQREPTTIVGSSGWR